jgi:hypothetical protein
MAIENGVARNLLKAKMATPNKAADPRKEGFDPLAACSPATPDFGGKLRGAFPAREIGTVGWA